MKILLVVTLLNLIGASTEANLAEQAPDFKGRWENIQQLVESGKLQRAVEETKALIPHLPKPQEGYNFLGVIYELLKNPKQAEAAYLKAFEIEPDSIKTLTNLGTLYAAQNRFDLVFSYLSPIRKSIQGNPEACFALIRAALLSQKHDIAQEVIKALKPEIVQQGTLSLALGSLLQQYEFHDQAVTHFRRAADLLPEDYRVFFGLGISYFQLRDYQQAKASTRTALRLNPELVQSLTLLGKIALEEGDLGEGRKWLSESLSKNAENDHVLFLLATIRMKENNYLEARRCLQKGIAINPNIPEYYFSLVSTYHEAHDYRGALDLARQTLGRFPENPDAFFNVAIELTFVDEFEQAKEHFRKTIEAFKKFRGQQYMQTLIAAKYKLAHLSLRAESSYEEASRLLKEVLEMDPNYIEAYLDLARINLRQREYMSAGHLLKRAIALNPLNGAAHYLMARTLSLAGNEKEAEREYLKFDALRSDSSENPQLGMVE